MNFSFAPPTCPAPHPALLTVDQLLADCELRQTRRGGPGGQHRNKVSTAIVLLHRPSGITGEAAERRSQVDNRRMAIRRLREALAVELRTAELSEGCVEGDRLRAAYRGKHFRVASDNLDRPALLALLLDDLWSAEGDTQPVAASWQTTASQIVRFLKTTPPAFQWLNRLRDEHGRGTLR
ncbi:peptide chain release factor family protein [Planctomycetaceae bacterium SH139]